MWSARSFRGDDGQAVRVEINFASSSVSYAEVLQRWQMDVDFRIFFIDLLNNTPFSAFRWETPSVTIETLSRPFEFVILNSPDLAKKPDVEAFSEYFSSVNSDEVIEFPNLGKDAILIVPCPGEPLSAYVHLAAYLRYGPDAQQHVLWQLVGKTMQGRLSDKPVWLSTAGAGVAWLHIRLDDRPKYYGYSPYRQMISF